MTIEEIFVRLRVTFATAPMNRHMHEALAQSKNL